MRLLGGDSAACAQGTHTFGSDSGGTGCQENGRLPPIAKPGRHHQPSDPYNKALMSWDRLVARRIARKVQPLQPCSEMALGIFP
jgi:hypothetical protein